MIGWAIYILYCYLTIWATDLTWLLYCREMDKTRQLRERLDK